ncbi:MAG: hypothetical protein M5U26_13565 [Planctomycetota bacterium]|nr:hypothetical protein [Planctomycetota bacterium]
MHEPRSLTFVFLLLLIGCAGARWARAESSSGSGLLPWATNTHPTDAPKRHSEEVAARKHEYKVEQGGTLDGDTCRGPIGTYEAFQQTWESNRGVRLENVGETDVVNPWLSNGRNLLRSTPEIIATATEAGMSDAEKAMALYRLGISYRWHNPSDNKEVMDPVKVYNVYGYNTCGNDSICMAVLWSRAGLKVTPAHTVGHCISQVFYDNAWHLLDGDMQSQYLLRDGKTFASEQDLVRDHDLIKRAHTQGILRGDARGGNEFEAALYVYEGEPSGTRNGSDKHTMNMVLRPNEALVWRWGRLEPLKFHGPSVPKFKDTVCNGLWEYRPDFAKETWKKGAASIEGVQSGAGGLSPEEGKTGVVVWKIACPYVLVGGRLEAEGQGAKFSASVDGKAWQPVTGELDALFPAKGAAVYEYQLRCELPAGAKLAKLAIVNDLQMAPLALPGMRVGSNPFTYSDETQGERKVRITHEWVERSATKPPAAPEAALEPADGAEDVGSHLVFKWKPAADPDGDKIADYHFELSGRPDMRWPYSSSFTRLVSLTSDRGKAQFTVDEAGHLAPQHTYYWRVRAKDDKGAWGPWSKTWSFKVVAPAVPLDVTLNFDAAQSAGTLRWKPNPAGSKAVKYRVYGSDEKGFTASDAPLKVTVGKAKDLPSTFPANFVAETEALELVVVGRNLDLPNANKAHYRVVAVDEKGRRSTASDYANAPRAFIYGAPPAKAKLGQAYSFQAGAIRSIGDLRSRGGVGLGFHDIESPAFALEKAPAWLKVDPKTGLLSGTPDAAGSFDVTLAAALDKEVLKFDVSALSWGNDKVAGKSVERLGEDKLSFAIQVEP